MTKAPNVDSSTVIINWSYRLKPNKQQIFGIDKTLKTCCNIYNICVDMDRTIYEETKIGISADDLSNYLKDDNIGDELHATVRQNVCRRFGTSKSRFLSGLSGAPKFKKYKNYCSFTYVKSGFEIVNNPKASNPRNKFLYLSKLIEDVEGEEIIYLKAKDGGCKTKKDTKQLVRMIMHRSLPKNGVIKTATIIRKNSGKCYVNFAIEVPKEDFFEISKTAGNCKAVGIDLGLESFITLSDGTKIEPPHFFKKKQKKLRREQQKLSRKQEAHKAATKAANKGRSSDERKIILPKSANYEKQRKRVAKLHEKIANQRKDFDYQLTHKLVNEIDNIACENLSPKFMIANRKLSKAASDAGFSKFKTILEYEAFKHQTKVVFVPPKFTTQDCSVCRNRIKKDLSERVHECHCCGVIIDRDVNAAINVLLKAAPEFSKDTVYLVTDKLRWDSAKDTLSENASSEPPDFVDGLGVCVVEERSHSL